MQWKISAKLVAGIMTMISATALMSCGTNSATADTVVMQVDTQEITKEEYQMILSGYVANVKSNYTTKEANREDFWESEFENGTPLTEIMELAGEELTYKKTLAELAEEQGSKMSTSYRDIAAQFTKENTDRTNKSNQKEVVYGLLSYEMEDYYEYVYSGVENEVMENLKADISISQKEIETYYGENAEDYTCSIRVDTMIAELRRESGMELAYEAMEAMSGEQSEEALEALYPEINFYPLTMSDLNTEEGKNGAYTMRWLTACAMQTGEICEPFEIGDHIMVIYCIEREENVLCAYEEVETSIKNYLQTNKAREIVQNKMEHAKIVYDDKVLKQVTLEALQN